MDDLSRVQPPHDEAFLDAFRRRYPFPLDPFQEEAIRLIASGVSVIVSAPTGAGKTLIAEFAMLRTLREGGKLFYTTPIKALSNQKFGDFCRQFGDASVGLLTGDVKVNPTAPLIVMTTEILRNMFYLDPPEDVAYVVLDECHYMGDEGRGTVWEEIIIHCPKDVPLIALSATVANIGEIADWISEVHRPIAAVSSPIRPVPLEYLLVDPAGEVVPAADVPKPGSLPAMPDDAHRRPHRRRGPDSNKVIQQLQARRWLPTLYFIFSRVGCERALQRLLAGRLAVIDPGEQDAVEEAIEWTLRTYPSIALQSELNQLILQGLRRGAGVHHAGILPALKRLTEGLFERGLVKVVFATETMSLGIHMPARSVVIQDLRKRSELGFRTLKVSELTQMAGRAGRRGIDTEGKCIIGTDGRESLQDALGLIRGTPEPIESRFRIGYSSAALLVRIYPEPVVIRQTIERSFGQFQARKRVRRLEAEWEKRLRKLSRREGLAPTCCELKDFVAYQANRMRMAAGNLAARRGEGRRRGRRRPARSPWDAVLGSDGGSEGVPVRDPTDFACHACPERRRLEQRFERSRRLKVALQEGMAVLGRVHEPYWHQFLRVARVLHHFGYLEAGQLSVEGRLVAALRHENELLVARVLFAGILDDLSPAELVALLSCLIEEPREAEPLYARNFLQSHPSLQKRVRRMQDRAEELLQVQHTYQISLPIAMHIGYLVPTYRWASGEGDWLRLVQDTYGGHEGDLIRAFRRLIDLCRQLAENLETGSAMQEKLWQAVSLLDRDIILESALL